MASFVLSGEPGDYSLGFHLSGPSSQQYASSARNGSLFSLTNESLTILSVATSPPAPSLQSVVFSSTGNSMSAYFDSSTNKGGITEVVWTCSRIFNFAGADRTSCVWLNASTVVMTFNYESGMSLVVPGGSVSVLNGTVQASCSSSASACPYVPPSGTNAVAPSNPLYPSIKISMPPTIGVCMNVSVDASSSYGSGGRDWMHVVWTVSAGNGTDASAIQNALSFYTDISSPFVLDSSLLGFTTYTITLGLTNFLGMTSYASSDVTKLYVNKTSSGVVTYQPTVDIMSSKFRTTKPANTFTARATATLPVCASGQALTYSWYAYRNYIYQSSIKSSSADPRRLLIDQYTLSAGQSYQFVVTVTASGGGSGQALLQVYVESGGVEAVITGGTTRAVAIGLNVTLDASFSADTNLKPSQDQNLKYTWTCSVLSFNSFGASCASLFIGSLTKSTAQVMTGDMDFENSYSFAVLVKSMDGSGRYSSASTTLRTVSGDLILPSITISSSKLSSNNTLKLSSTISGSVSAIATWSL
jgi:hypothetical protein